MSEERKIIYGEYLRGERPEKFETPSGIPIKEVYTPEDLKGFDYAQNLGNPGEYPFTRGIHPNMYRGRMWTRRFQVGFGTPQATNERIRFVYGEGSTALTLTCDEATIHGLDADHPLAEGEIGNTGTSISTLEDLDITLSGFPLNKTSVTLSMGNIVSSVFLAMYAALAERQGVRLDKVIGTIQLDPFFITNAGSPKGITLFLPMDLIVRLAVDSIEFCARNMPRMNWVAVNAYNVRDAGLNAIQEGAVSIAVPIYLYEKVLERGLEIDEFAPRASFLNSSDIDFFEDIAKLRAIRRIYARTLKERFGAKNPRSMWYRTAVQGAGSSYTAQQPLNNIIRGTIEFLALVLSGPQSIMVASYDESLGLPTEESSRISLRIQQIVGYESGLTKVVDPLAGSYFLESLTNRMEEEISKTVSQIEEMGGMVEVFNNGWIEGKMTEGRVKKQKEVEKGERVIVGVNKFTMEEEQEIKLHRPLPEWEEERKRYLKDLKRRRNNQKVKDFLSLLSEKVKGNENLVPFISEALKAEATLGEIMDAMRSGVDFRVAL